MRDKVRSNCDRLTQNSYLDAVSETVRGVQGGSTDQDMADAWGTSSGTVLNARNKAHALGAVPLLKIGAEWGPAALDKVLALIGARAVPLEAVTVDAAGLPCDVAEAVPLLFELLRDGVCCDDDIRRLDRAGVIDCMKGHFDALASQRDALAIRRVI